MFFKGSSINHDTLHFELCIISLKMLIRKQSLKKSRKVIVIGTSVLIEISPSLI